MPPKSSPSIFSLALAHNSAIGHINAGLTAYREFARLGEGGFPESEIYDRTLSQGIPAFTNMAFGLELLLKAYHFQVFGAYPKLGGRDGHNIAKLGLLFAGTELERLRTRYRDLVAIKAHEEGAYDAVVTASIAGEVVNPTWNLEPTTYDEAIAFVGEQYVALRYIYERFETRIEFPLSFLPVRRLIDCVQHASKRHRGNVQLHVGAFQQFKATGTGSWWQNAQGSNRVNAGDPV